MKTVMRDAKSAQERPPSMSLSREGLELLKDLEGAVKRRGRHVVYDDATGKPLKGKPQGYATIGYGHRINAGETFPARGIEEPRAEALLRKDLERFERAIDRRVDVPLTQSQYDALCIFAFNIGTGGFASSTALKRLNAGDYTGCAEAMTWWNKTTIKGRKVQSEGLVKRRRAEADLFLRDPAPAPKPPEPALPWWKRLFNTRS